MSPTDKAAIGVSLALGVLLIVAAIIDHRRFP